MLFPRRPTEKLGRRGRRRLAWGRRSGYKLGYIRRGIRTRIHTIGRRFTPEGQVLELSADGGVSEGVGGLTSALDGVGCIYGIRCCVFAPSLLCNGKGRRVAASARMGRRTFLLVGHRSRVDINVVLGIIDGCRLAEARTV